MLLEVNKTEIDMKLSEVLKPYQPEKYYQEIPLLPQPEKCNKLILLLLQLQSAKQRPKTKRKGQ